MVMRGVLGVCLCAVGASALVAAPRPVSRRRWVFTRGAGAGGPNEGTMGSGWERRFYDFDGWRCAYRHRPGDRRKPALLVIHPVGIGLSSWFWRRLVESEALAGYEIFAADLIGCGDSEAWRPAERGLFVPLDWARQQEQLWRVAIQRPCFAVAQGGLAQVGVLLASRANDRWDGARSIKGLVLASPPSWDDIAKGSSRRAVERSYAFLTAPLGAASYILLRQRAFVRFFSDLFLFNDRCDEEWVDLCCTEATRPAAEQPVFAFNAGIVGMRGLYDELVELQSPLLLLEGRGDRRAETRDGYVDNVPRCDRRTVDSALNVLPWEAPDATAQAIADFIAASK